MLIKCEIVFLLTYCGNNVDIRPFVLLIIWMETEPTHSETNLPFSLFLSWAFLVPIMMSVFGDVGDWKETPSKSPPFRVVMVFL
jgi:hypothetical protein